MEIEIIDGYRRIQVENQKDVEKLIQLDPRMPQHFVGSEHFEQSEDSKNFKVPITLSEFLSTYLLGKTTEKELLSGPKQ